MEDLLIIAGPCAVESRKQIFSLAEQLQKLNITYLRGGAFKPRTNPESFQGLKAEGLKYLIGAGHEYKMKVVSEVMSSEDLHFFVDVDVIQVGARNMHNSSLLTAIGKLYPEKTILIKRGFAATKKELLGALGYLKASGHTGKVWVCERGIRSFDDSYSRFCLDVGLIADLTLNKKMLGIDKVVVDPSHAAGRSELVSPLARAGIGAGSTTLMIEVKLEVSEPLSDGRQAITVEELKEILENKANK